MKEQEFYDKEFTCGQSVVSRGELESLPVPFCTDDVTDDQMETIIAQTDAGTRQRLGLSDRATINFENDKHSEVWWEELEEAVRSQNVPYYEDLDK